MIIGEPSPWNKDAAALLTQFLETHTGKVFLAQLLYHRPALSSASDTSSVALQAKYVAGYEQAIAQIMNLTEPPVEAERPINNYPDLDDESQWGKQPEEKKE